MGGIKNKEHLLIIFYVLNSFREVIIMTRTFKYLIFILLGSLAATGIFFNVLDRHEKKGGVEQKEVELQEVKNILTLSPKYHDAKELGAHLKFVGETFKIDSKILIAIAFQESSFKLDAINDSDLGLFQLNYYHQIVRKGKAYSIQEVKDNWRLNAILAASYLRECMVYNKNPKMAPWVCYHSFTPEKALLYEQSVKRHLSKLK